MEWWWKQRKIQNAETKHILICFNLLSSLLVSLHCLQQNLKANVLGIQLVLKRVCEIDFWFFGLFWETITNYWWAIYFNKRSFFYLFWESCTWEAGSSRPKLKCKIKSKTFCLTKKQSNNQLCTWVLPWSCFTSCISLFVESPHVSIWDIETSPIISNPNLLPNFVSRYQNHQNVLKFEFHVFFG